MTNRNIINRTDSYKHTHWLMYPDDTEYVYSYHESRMGATYPETVFVGLEPLLQSIAGFQVTQPKINAARRRDETHFGSKGIFNEAGWDRILRVHDGKLPLRIKAVEEGTPVPNGNVLMTVENTDPELAWLTNAVESLLLHVWYPEAVATLSRTIKQDIAGFLDTTVGNRDGLEFMLHDFGYRGSTSDESAEIGGLAHLVNFKGTDTLLAMDLAEEVYSADPNTLAFSVPASEHSVMTSGGPEGEFPMVDHLISKFPTGILSVVADSYDFEAFMRYICRDEVRRRIEARDGKFVARPDSIPSNFTDACEVTVWMLKEMARTYGTRLTKKGFNVLNPKVGGLWGDGNSRQSINDGLTACADFGFAASNMVYGMGGGLLQEVTRDTQDSAFKSSAQCRAGDWHDVYKITPKKSSKRGRLALVKDEDGYKTVRESERDNLLMNLLQLRFLNGEVMNSPSFEQVRVNAAI